jgi:hypothetical protein
MKIYNVVDSRGAKFELALTADHVPALYSCKDDTFLEMVRTENACHQWEARPFGWLNCNPFQITVIVRPGNARQAGEITVTVREIIPTLLATFTLPCN